jgi:hypothetical protein
MNYIDDNEPVKEAGAGIVVEGIQATRAIDAQHQKLESRKDERTYKETFDMEIALKQAEQGKERKSAEKRKLLKKRDGADTLSSSNGSRKLAEVQAATEENASSAAVDGHDRSSSVVSTEPNPLYPVASEASATPKKNRIPPSIMGDRRSINTTFKKSSLQSLGSRIQNIFTNPTNTGSQRSQSPALSHTNSAMIAQDWMYDQSQSQSRPSSAASSAPPATPNQSSYSQLPAKSLGSMKIQQAVPFPVQANQAQPHYQRARSNSTAHYRKKSMTNRQAY